MDAAEIIADLDGALAQGGETITLKRAFLESDGETQNYWAVQCAAKVVLYQPQEIIDAGGGVQDTLIIISPTQMLAAGWPVPPVKDDQIFLGDGTDDTTRGNVEIVGQERWQGQTVRYELKCRF